MAGREFAFDPPDRFVAGTVGQPGERTFFLQATGDGRTVSVALEKLQVSALAERLDELLDEVRRRQGAESTVPATSPPQLEDVAPLDAPIEEEFRVGTLALAWDDDDALVIIEAQSAIRRPTRRKARRRTSRPTPTCCGSGSSPRWRGRSQARASGRRGRSAAVPAVRQPAGPRGPHLPAAERPPARRAELAPGPR